MQKAHYTNANIDSKTTIEKRITDIKLLALRAILLGFVTQTPFSAKGQETWSMKSCIDYTLTSNIDLIISNNNIEKQKITID